jgi:hypothetical protein
VLLEEAAIKHGDERRLKRELSDEGGPPKKKAKGPAKSLGEMSTSDLKSAVANDTLGKFTVSELKEFCLDRGLPSSGKKGDLVVRVEEYVEGA